MSWPCRIKLNERLLFLHLTTIRSKNLYVPYPLWKLIVRLFGKKVNPKNKNFWIYTAKKNNILKPDNNHPIVQSYVDIFLNGCFQVQDKFKIYNFSKLCVETTKGWSSNWVNDRVHPRRPFLIPNFYRIDNLLSEKFSYYLNNQIE